MRTWTTGWLWVGDNIVHLDRVTHMTINRDFANLAMTGLDIHTDEETIALEAADARAVLDWLENADDVCRLVINNRGQE